MWVLLAVGWLLIGAGAFCAWCIYLAVRDKSMGFGAIGVVLLGSMIGAPCLYVGGICLCGYYWGWIVSFIFGISVFGLYGMWMIWSRMQDATQEKALEQIKEDMKSNSLNEIMRQTDYITTCKQERIDEIFYTVKGLIVMAKVCDLIGSAEARRLFDDAKQNKGKAERI